MIDLVIRSLLTLLGVIFFLYFFWKKLKDDYSAHQIFTTGFISLIGIGLGYLISRYLLEYLWFWLSGIGSFLGLMFSVRKYKLRFFETLEGWVIGSLSVLFFLYSYELWNSQSLITLINLISVILLMGTFFYINARYKRYVWYRSGKVGFSGLLTTGLYFAFRSSNIFFSGIMDNRILVADIVLSAVIAFVSFLTLFNLSRKSI